jgi:hypothetical protein
MTKNKAFWISLVLVMGTAPMALAKSAVDEARPASQPISPLPKASTLADNVVVTPSGQTAPAQPVYSQPAPAPQPVPVVDEPRRRSEVHADVSPPRNYAATIAVSALMGGVAGALIGGAIYYLDNQNHPYNVVYWAAGGVLVGTGVGLMQIMVQESRASEATAVNRLPSDPAPTFRLALYRVNF